MFLDTVFLAGNFEAQRLSWLRNKKQRYTYIKKHFIFSCLLSERVFFPAANYFQSEITQRITDEFAPLFRYSDRYQQTVFVAINPSKEDFRGEALEKKDTYLDLPDYEGYMNNDSRERLVKRLNSITQPYMRYGKLVESLSEYIQNETKVDGVLFKLINKYIGSEAQTRKIFDPLVSAVERQEKAIIPEYIITQDRNGNIDKHSERLMRLSLMKAYSASLQQLYIAYVNNPLIQTYDAEYLFPYSINYLDTTLFDMFLQLFPEIYREICSIKANQVNALKFSERFIIFKHYYIDFIEKLSSESLDFKQIPFILSEEKKHQVENYKMSLSELINNSAFAIMLYNSMASTIVRVKRTLGFKIKKSTEIFSNYDAFFVYALVNEVSESFMNQYETLLRASLRDIYFKQGRKIIMLGGNTNINNGGVQFVNTKVTDSTIMTSIGCPQEMIMSLSDEECDNMKKFADIILSQCTELEMSKRLEIAGLIHNIVEHSKKNNGNINGGVVLPFKKVFETLSKVSKETLIKIAAGILAPIVIKILGLS